MLPAGKLPGVNMFKKAVSLAVAVPMMTLAAPAVAQAPSMSSAWLTIKLDQDACVKLGSEAMKSNGLTRAFEVLGNSSIYGEVGSYTGLVRCAADKEIAYFVVAGPVGKECSRYMNAVRDYFRDKQ